MRSDSKATRLSSQTHCIFNRPIQVKDFLSLVKCKLIGHLLIHIYSRNTTSMEIAYLHQAIRSTIT